jgi:signal transduction histidine kinase
VLKFSFGLPRRSIRRLDAAPQIADLQQILTLAMEETEKDFGISWPQGSDEFRLVVRHRASQLLWRLLNGSGLAAQVIWSTNETNLRTVLGQVIARSNDHMDARDERAAPFKRNPELSQSAAHRVLSSLAPGDKHSGLPQTPPTAKAGPEPGRRAAPGGNQPGIILEPWQLEGDLSRVRMIYLIQSLSQENASGCLTIVGAEDVAEIYFYYGSLVHAKASNSEGTDTVLEVICWESGQYKFDQTTFAEEGTIRLTFDQLMKYDMELLAQANELEEHGLHPTSVICRQRIRLGEAALEDLMQKSAALKRIFLATTQPLTVAALVERVRLPRSQFIPALAGLLQSGLLGFWNEQDEKRAPHFSSMPETKNTAATAAGATLGSTTSASFAVERFAFQQLIRAKPEAHEDLWIQALATPGGVEKIPELSQLVETMKRPLDKSGKGDSTKPEEIPQETKLFAQAAYDYLQIYTSLFNRYAFDQEMSVTTSELGEVAENCPPSTKVPPGQFRASEAHHHYWRWRSSTTTWSLNCRARGNSVEFFLVPASESVRLGEAEQDYRRKLKLDRILTEHGSLWIADGLPVIPSDIRLLLRQCFRDLVRTTIADLQFGELGYDERQILSAEGQTAFNTAQHIKQIVYEKQNLAQKIVSQQEEIQRRISRDLHDAVIADVTMLKRSLDGEARLNRSDTVKSLEQIIQRLREICYDLSPSDLRDWGLSTTIEAMLDHVSQRTGAECELICNDEIPPLEGPVELHIFRIIQEALNNSAKYSGASYITVTSDVEDGCLVFRVEDDGKGFDPVPGHPRATKDGGTGMSSMQERTQLIQCFYPAKLDMKSEPGRGTITRLSIKLPASVLAHLTQNKDHSTRSGEF